MENLKKISLDLMAKQNFDSLAVAVLDFKKNKIQSFEITNKEELNDKPELYFDLASLTKPLSLASLYLISPDIFDKNDLLLLDYQAGLPEGGRLSREDWKEQIMSYKIKKSPVLYSDYSALRLMLEIEKKTKERLVDLCKVFWDKELVFWKNLPEDAKCPETGSRNWKTISGEVHDDNAFIIGRFCSHAGLFSTIDGLARSIFNLDKKYKLRKKLEELLVSWPADQEYVHGWDRVMNEKDTLAGAGASMKTFGHLGFTGTSIWIDLEKDIGHIILTNATQNYWYDRDGLNELRRAIGSHIWKNF